MFGKLALAASTHKRAEGLLSLSVSFAILYPSGCLNHCAQCTHACNSYTLSLCLALNQFIPRPIPPWLTRVVASSLLRPAAPSAKISLNSEYSDHAIYQILPCPMLLPFASHAVYGRGSFVLHMWGYVYMRSFTFHPPLCSTCDKVAALKRTQAGCLHHA